MSNWTVAKVLFVFSLLYLAAQVGLINQLIDDHLSDFCVEKEPLWFICDLLFD